MSGANISKLVMNTRPLHITCHEYIHTDQKLAPQQSVNKLFPFQLQSQSNYQAGNINATYKIIQFNPISTIFSIIILNLFFGKGVKIVEAPLCENLDIF